MLHDFTSLSYLLAPFVHTVVLLMKQLNIFFGNVPDGTLYVRITLHFDVFLVLLVPNGQIVFYIVVGLSFTVIIGFHYSIIWILLMIFQI